MRRPSLDWTNTLFMALSHALAVLGVLWLVFQFHWQTAVLGLAYMALCGLAITGGYHRLFSHPTYKAIAPLRAMYLFFGAASVQNSALKWSADHRRHHKRVDTSEDPYEIRRGFWWAHIGWVLHKDPKQDERGCAGVADLQRDRLVMFQHDHYLALAWISSALLPVALGWMWGDPIGGFLVAGFLRLVVQWHATFSVNSFAHMIGTQPYGDANTSRDSWITAILTLGEGYHNFHHAFQADYRNGVRWYQLDPTKWFVWSMSKVGVTAELKRVPRATILDRRSEAKAA